MNTKWLDRTIGLLVSALALAVYLSTLSRGAFPGVSATLVTVQLGLAPTLSPAAPLYNALARGLVGVTGTHAVQALNLFSAFCASGAVFLLYSLMRHGICFFTEEYQVTEGRRRLASILAGLVAAIFLAFCIPFWSVANRAHQAAFDVFLLLLLARLFTGYAAGGGAAGALVLALLYGAGMAQSATLIVFLPMFSLALLYVMWKRETLRGWLPAALGLLFIVGLMTYALAAATFHESPGYEIRGYRSFMQILWHSWRDQYVLITRSLPREGWLVILFVTIAPWLAMFAAARRALNDDRDGGTNILHVLMTVLVVAVALNARVAPWAMLGWGRLLVTPYVLMAMVAGYLAAFWFLLPGQRRETGWALDVDVLRRVTGRTVLAGLLGTGLWAAWYNAEAVSTRGVGTLHALAGTVVDGLDGRTWLITDGRLDNHLLLAARDKGITLRLLNLTAGGSPLYLDYVATLFDDIRLRNLATLSLSALLREWVTPGSGIERQLAVLSFPDFWPRHGFQSVPDSLLFKGEETPRAGEVEALSRRHVLFCDTFAVWLSEASAVGGVGAPWVSWARGHAGMVANNLGVLLEDHGLSQEALQAYRSAHRLDPQNVSAVLNMWAMVQAGRATDADGSVETAIKALEAGLDGKYHIWSLSRHYGTVRMPEAFAQLGWTWAYSGQPGMAIAQIEKAADLLPDDQRASIQGIMADLYLMDNRPLESEPIYKAILQQTPGSLPALQGLMRIALMQRQYERAEAYRLQALEHGLDPVQAVFQQAVIESAAGRLAPARARLETLLQDRRQLLRGWVLLAEIGMASGDERLVDQSLRRIEGIEGTRGFHGSVLRGRLAYERQDLAVAADHFAAALVRQPGQRRLLELLLRLDLALGRADSVRRHVRALLQADPGHALALYVRGSLQIADGEYALAENSLRESLRRTRQPMALNDLAWLLVERGGYDEAEALVNEALALNERQPAAWDTKGIVLLRTGRTEEAEIAFGRSIALFANNPTVHLHMGEAQLALGKTAAVRDMLELIVPFREQLQPRDRELFNRLRDAVR